MDILIVPEMKIFVFYFEVLEFVKVHIKKII
jgi:hypothetical protein